MWLSSANVSQLFFQEPVDKLTRDYAFIWVLQQWITCCFNGSAGVPVQTHWDIMIHEMSQQGDNDVLWNLILSAAPALVQMTTGVQPTQKSHSPPCECFPIDYHISLRRQNESEIIIFNTLVALRGHFLFKCGLNTIVLLLEPGFLNHTTTAVEQSSRQMPVVIRTEPNNVRSSLKKKGKVQYVYVMAVQPDT
jgi:hypothetical protein